MANPFAIDILSGQQGINRGLANLGGALGGLRQQNEQRQLMEQQQQKEVAAQQRMQEGAAKYQQAIQNNDIGEIANLMLEYPGLQQAAEKAYGFANDQTRKIAQDIYVQGYLNPEQAPKILAEGAPLIQKAGGQPIMTLQDAESLQGLSPDEIRNKIGIGIASINPELGKQLLGQTQTIQQKQRQQQIDLDVNKFNYEKEQDKIKNQNKALENELKKSNSEAKTKAVQQRIDDNNKKSEKIKQDRISDAQSSLLQAQDTVDLINRITSSEGFSSAVGTKGASSFFGLLDKPIAGTQAADTTALIDNLESKNFLNAIQQMKGLGALSDAEGKKLSSAIQNLSRDQSEKQLKSNLNEVVDLTSRAIEKAKKIIEKEGGELPKTKPDAPQSAIDFLKKNPNLLEQFKNKYGYTPEGL